MHEVVSRAQKHLGTIRPAGEGFDQICVVGNFVQLLRRPCAARPPGVTGADRLVALSALAAQV
jgi:hypothetical protein